MSGSPEFALLASLTSFLDGDGPGVPVGVGDDAAVIEVGGAAVALAVDTLVGGVHFDLGFSSFADVGFKALVVNVSDVASMGAQPQAAVVSLQRPPDVADAQVHEIYTGLRQAADRYRCKLVGGDTVGAGELALSVTVLGPLLGPEPLRRDAAEEGDVVVLLGEVGLAAAGLAAYRAGATELLERFPELAAAHRRPRAYPEGGAALAVAGANACIDISDGLGRDLGHVATRSGVAIALDPERLPVPAAVRAAAETLGRDPIDFVVAGGDDYALAATVRSHRVERVEAALGSAGLHAHVLGSVTAGTRVWLGERDISHAGWEHEPGDAP